MRASVVEGVGAGKRAGARTCCAILKTTMAFFLGIDGGGSKTECVLADESGAVLARATGPGSNLHRVDSDQLWGTVRDCLAQLRRSTGLGVIAPVAVGAGFAGASDSEAREMARRALVKCLHPARLYVVGDMEVALEAAVGAGRGVVLIAGTGSIAYGRNDLGRQARAGGRGINVARRGKFIVDEGSGLDIGLRATRAVVNPLLFWRRWTPLGRRVKKVFQGASGEGGVVVFVEAAGLVPLVVEAARENDARARRILEGAADALAGLAVEVLRQLDLLEADVRVAASGGVFKESPEVFARVQAEILKAAPRARVEPLAVSPAEGAARLAQRLWLQEQTTASA